MACVVGVDGYRHGWVAVPVDLDRGLLSPRGFTSFQELIASFEFASAICVDIPIGLGSGQARVCDRLARKMLRHRHVTVFTPPARRLIEELFEENAPLPEYVEVNSRSKQIASQGISQQAYRICPKIAEVDRVVTPALQRRIIEVHPEVSFCALVGQPIDVKKDNLEGYEVRRNLLIANTRWRVWTRAQAGSMVIGAAPDDLLDAAVAAWTATKVLGGRETRLTSKSERDSRGLRMEIVY